MIIIRVRIVRLIVILIDILDTYALKNWLFKFLSLTTWAWAWAATTFTVCIMVNWCWCCVVGRRFLSWWLIWGDFLFLFVDFDSISWLRCLCFISRLVFIFGVRGGRGTCLFLIFWRQRFFILRGRRFVVIRVEVAWNGGWEKICGNIFWPRLLPLLDDKDIISCLSFKLCGRSQS